MTMKNHEIRNIIMELDNLSNHQKQLSDKLVRLMVDQFNLLDADDKQTLTDYAERARTCSAGFVVTAAMVCNDLETSNTTRHLFRNRCAVLRVVQ